MDNVLNHPPKAAARLLAGLPRLARAALMGKGATDVEFVTLAVGHETLEALVRPLESGQVRVVIEQTYPFDETAGAVAHVLEHHAVGKVAITV